MEKKQKSFSLYGENGKLYYGWIIVIAGGLITGFVYNGIVSTTGVMMLPVMTDMQFDPAAFSLYLTIMSVTGIATLLCVQKLFSEKFLKPLMLIAGIAVVISFIGFSMAKSLMWFYIFAIPQGFGFTAMTMTPCELIVSNWFGAKAKGRAISLMLTLMTLVLLAELNVLQKVVTASGWRAGYMLLAGGVVIAIICVFFFKWSPETIGVKRMGDLSDEELASMQMKNTLASGYSFAQVVKKPIFWLILISTTLAVMSSSSILQHNIPTMVIAGMTPEKATAIVSLTQTVMIVTGFIIGVIMDKAPLCVAATGSALCFAGACVGLALMGSNLSMGMGVYVCLYIFGVASINIVSPVIMAYRFGEKDMPKLLSWLNMFISIGGAVGALGVSMMLEHFGSYTMPWIIMAVILAVSAIIRLFATMPSARYKVGDENL